MIEFCWSEIKVTLQGSLKRVCIVAKDINQARAFWLRLQASKNMRAEDLDDFYYDTWLSKGILEQEPTQTKADSQKQTYSVYIDDVEVENRYFLDSR